MADNVLRRSHLEDVRDRLRRFVDQADALLELIDGRTLLGAARRVGRDQYRKFKQRLRDEYRRGATLRGEASLTEAERRFYRHAIHGAYCQLRLPVSCVPGPELFSQVYAARIDITHALDQAEQQLRDGCEE